MKLCDCGGRLETKRLEVYQDKRLGLPNITLRNAVSIDKCALCGTVENITISNLEGLIATVAVSRITIPNRLTGPEILFLRKAMEFTAKELAEKLEVGEQTISRWENNVDPIGLQSDKLLRILVGQQLHDRAPLVPFKAEDILSMRIAPIQSRPPRMTFTLVNNPERSEEWKQEEGRRRASG